MAQPPLHIAGYQVAFPYKPYGTQLGFMNQFLRAVDQQGNALLEAPTGSGKTACLLASALAWQKRHLEAAAAAKARNLIRSISRSKKGKAAADGGAGAGGAGGAAADAGAAAAGAAPPAPGAGSGSGSEGSGGDDCGGKQAGGGPADAADDEVPDPHEEDEEIPRVPKIYYATRTHSQIAQASARARGSRTHGACGCQHAAARMPAPTLACQRRFTCRAGHLLLRMQSVLCAGAACRPQCPARPPQVIKELKGMGLSPRMAVLVGGGGGVRPASCRVREVLPRTCDPHAPHSRHS